MDKEKVGAWALSKDVGDRLVSLEDAMNRVDGRAIVRLAEHFSPKWLSARRTDARLGLLLLLG